MERGWDATGRLTAVYETCGGRKGVAEKTGIREETLSGYNSGALRMGERNGRRIAEACNVTIQDLGAPPTDEEEEELRAVVADLAARIERLEGSIRRLRGQLAQIRQRPVDPPAPRPDHEDQAPVLS